MKIRFTNKLPQDKLYSENFDTVNVRPGQILEIDSYKEDCPENNYYTIFKDGIEYDGVLGEWFELVNEEKTDYFVILTNMMGYDDLYRHTSSKSKHNFVVFFDVNMNDYISGLRDFDQAILNVNTGDLILMNFSPVFKIETRIVENKSYVVEETISF